MRVCPHGLPCFEKMDQLVDELPCKCRSKVVGLERHHFALHPTDTTIALHPTDTTDCVVHWTCGVAATLCLPRLVRDGLQGGRRAVEVWLLALCVCADTQEW